MNPNKHPLFTKILSVTKFVVKISPWTLCTGVVLQTFIFFQQEECPNPLASLLFANAKNSTEDVNWWCPTSIFVGVMEVSQTTSRNERLKYFQQQNVKKYACRYCMQCWKPGPPELYWYFKQPSSKHWFSCSRNGRKSTNKNRDQKQKLLSVCQIKI